MCGPRNEEHSEETGTESEMTEGTEETITDPVEFLLPSRTRRGMPRKPTVPRKIPTSSIYSVEFSFAIRAEKIAACICKRIISISSRLGKSLKGCRQGSCFFLTKDQSRWKSQRSTRVRTPRISVKLRLKCVESTRTQQCDRAGETEQWLSEDFYRQRCEVRARRDAKLCCKILIALG